jgi:hypothetical protein
MRISICAFAFLAVASLTRAQVASLPERQTGEISCTRSRHVTDDIYHLRNARSFLALAQRDDVVYLRPDPAVQNMGDGASIAVLKIVPPDVLIKPEFVKVYLRLATTAFSDPKLTFRAEDKSPKLRFFY